MDTFKLNITPKWDPETQTLLFDTQGISAEIRREMVCFKDRIVREHLIAMGWTPPQAAHGTFDIEHDLTVPGNHLGGQPWQKVLPGGWHTMDDAIKIATSGDHSFKGNPFRIVRVATVRTIVYSSAESPRDTRNDGAPWTDPDRSGGGGHTAEEIDRARGDRY